MRCCILMVSLAARSKSLLVPGVQRVRETAYNIWSSKTAHKHGHMEHYGAFKIMTVEDLFFLKSSDISRLYYYSYALYFVSTAASQSFKTVELNTMPRLFRADPHHRMATSASNIIRRYRSSWRTHALIACDRATQNLYRSHEKAIQSKKVHGKGNWPMTLVEVNKYERHCACDALHILFTLYFWLAHEN